MPYLMNNTFRNTVFLDICQCAFNLSNFCKWELNSYKVGQSYFIYFWNEFNSELFILPTVYSATDTFMATLQNV